MEDSQQGWVLIHMGTLLLHCLCGLKCVVHLKAELQDYGA